MAELRNEGDHYSCIRIVSPHGKARQFEMLSCVNEAEVMSKAVFIKGKIEHSVGNVLTLQF